VSYDAGTAAPIAIPHTPLSWDVPHDRTGSSRTALAVAGDVFLAIGVVLCIPLVILAIGIPIALAVRLLLWLIGMM
jgi:hypothetical protein